MENEDPRRDIQARAFGLAHQVVVLCRNLRASDDVPWPLMTQRLRSATSIGANLEEAVAATSKRAVIAICVVAR